MVGYVTVAVPSTWTLDDVVAKLSPATKSQFQALKLQKSKKFDKKAFCYLKLNPNTDPHEFVQKVNKVNIKNFGPITARITPSANSKAIKKSVAKAAQKKSKFEDVNPLKVMVFTHYELLRELQSKYTGLFNLSKKCDHKLLEKLAKVIYERLKFIMEHNEEASESCYKLSKAYRKVHPHFADFQCILSNLHQIEDELVKPRTQINEPDLMATSTYPTNIEGVAYNKIIDAVNKYTEKMGATIRKHLDQLECAPAGESETEEEKARRKVVTELKKMGPYYQSMIWQVVSNQVLPQRDKLHLMRIYGDPLLPSKDAMFKFLNRFRPVKLHRSQRIHNLVTLNVSTPFYALLMRQDGTVVNDSKLIIRLSLTPLYDIPKSLTDEMKAMFKGHELPDDDEMNVDKQDEFKKVIEFDMANEVEMANAAEMNKKGKKANKANEAKMANEVEMTDAVEMANDAEKPEVETANKAEAVKET